MNPSLLQLSPTTRYGLSGMTYLARQPGNRFALVQEVAAAEKLPQHFLAKIFQQLAQRGFLTSRRGPGGGYALAQDPKKISVLDVLSALEGSLLSRLCFLEDRACDASKPCAMHDAAVAAGELLRKTLDDMTLADLTVPGSKAKKRSFHV